MAAKVAKGSIRKSKPIVTKTSLNSPYEKVWTPVIGEDMQFILKTLTEKFTQVGLKKVEIQKKFMKKRRKSKKESSDGTDRNPDVEGERPDGEKSKEETVMGTDRNPDVEGERPDGDKAKEETVMGTDRNPYVEGERPDGEKSKEETVMGTDRNPDVEGERPDGEKSKEETVMGTDRNPDVEGERPDGEEAEETVKRTDRNPDVEGERPDGEKVKEETVKAGWTLSDVRKHLAIGINEVTRSLEKNEVHLVIVCKSAKPQMITTHITELSASRGVPACQLPRLSENVAPVLGLKSVLALGFRNTSDIFLKEVRAIIPRVPPLKVPWLAGKPKRTKRQTKNTADDDGTGGENKDSVTSRKRKHLEATEAGMVQLQSLKVKKIVPNPNKKRRIKVKKGANKK